MGWIIDLFVRLYTETDSAKDDVIAQVDTVGITNGHEASISISNVNAV